MIVLGYPGIGKTTATQKNFSIVRPFIDLESSHFYFDGELSVYNYITVAKSLDSQGFDVFVSTHEDVRHDVAARSDMRNLIICPAPELKEEWVRKLKKRYLDNSTMKNENAWRNAKNNYDEHVNALINDDRFDHIVIHNMDYRLGDLLWRYFRTGESIM